MKAENLSKTGEWVEKKRIRKSKTFFDEISSKDHSTNKKIVPKKTVKINVSLLIVNRLYTEL